MKRHTFVYILLIGFITLGVYLNAVVVSSVSQLETAMDNANSGGDKEIILQDGTYNLNDSLSVWADGITVRSQSGNRNSVTIRGEGMYGGVEFIFYGPGSYFTVRNITLGWVANHAIQIWGHQNASNILISNCHIVDTYEQMVKITYESGNSNSSSNGVLENCLLEYSAGIGPQYYIGGIDGHQCKNWVVRGNTFKNISSPSGDVAEHAIHFWSASSDTLVENNLIINCDRGIGFGLGSSTHVRGIIRNNMIYHSSTDHGFSDVAIGLESASNAKVYNNTIYMANTYANAIEYRFSGTSGGIIKNILTNKAITARDGGSADTSNNITNAQSSWFINILSGDLHLSSQVSQVVDQGVAISGLTTDFDGDSRPQGAGIDIGADEYSSGTTPSLTLTSPNGGESWTVGTTHNISWTSSGAVGNIKLEYSVNNGTAWSTIVSSALNNGSYAWKVPNTPSSLCLVRISQAVDGTPNDRSDATFNILSTTGSSLTVTSPNGGESWKAASTHNVTWTSSGTIGNIKIQYSTNNGSNWSTVVSSTTNDGSYGWTVPNTPSNNCLIRISDAADGSPVDTSNGTFSIIAAGSGSPVINLNRTRLNYGATASGTITGEQPLLIGNTGTGTLEWNLSTNAAWLDATPDSGTNTGVITVSVNASGMSTGSYSATITITDSSATNSPQDVTVTLTVYQSNQTAGPIGEFSTPMNNAMVSSSIPVTGWVLDDIEVKSVKVYNGTDYVGDAVFVEGARPDVEDAYPGYPKNYRAGWGYMMLTNFLPNGGNGTYTLYAKAIDAEGHQVTLGSKTITCDNSNAEKPFGAIDTPVQGGSAAGSGFINWGWALTPQPNKIPVSGNTINVYVDGVQLGHPTYNIYRSDIASLFPGYANSSGAVGYFLLDTTSYDNGVHTIQWTATDNAGNTDGIGSRYFTVQNSNNRSVLTESTLIELQAQRVPGMRPFYSSLPVKIRSGNKENRSSHFIYPNDKGLIEIGIRELERVEMVLVTERKNNSDLMNQGIASRENETVCNPQFSGYSVAGGELRRLPIGSYLDKQAGIFYWSPGPGFLGVYHFRFVERETRRLYNIDITINPK